ncbi:MAG TPA: heparinase II/III family protein, partial [Anaerolineales bacterium]
NRGNEQDMFIFLDGAWRMRAGVMPSYPNYGAAVPVNPPPFTWPALDRASYQLEVKDAKGHISTFTSTRNWLHLSEFLVPGHYEWRVKSGTGSVTKAGKWFPFDIPTNAVKLVVPPRETLLGRASAISHPRSVNVASLRAKASLETFAFTQLLNKIKLWSGESLPLEPLLRPDLLPEGKDRDSQMLAIQQLAFGEENKVLPAALVWLAAGNKLALNEAKRRAMNLASWNDHGITSFKTHDQAGISVAWTLALAYDWLYPELSDSERNQYLAAIGSRLTEILGKVPYGLDEGRRIDVHPYDSHGAVTLARVSVICAVMAGTAPQFDFCFGSTVPRYLSWSVPWGRDDGGYANGTNYAQWDVAFTQFIVWNLLSKTIDFDLTETPWAKSYGKFMAYFLPPGTPTGLFGDGAEQNWRNVWATQAKAYAADIPSPLADWYARQQFGEDPLQLALLLAPAKDWSKVSGYIPPDTPNALLTPSIGWVAMHSNLADRGRNSVYFKSSPYGSFNHSHADQNGFVINAKGQPLAIDSGYYDYYNSPHWKGWYKQTRAHNAMTFDGGQGQMHDTMAAKGKITQFETTPAFDMVTGDATQAYGGALTRAVRSMVYVRPDTLLVFDSLASDTSRTWEWNIHAMEAMKVTGKRSIEIEKDGERLCVEVLSGPDVDFSQTDQFTFVPSGVYPKQWHGAFRSTARSKSFQMLTLLSVNCERPSIEVADNAGGLGVNVSGHRFAFTNSNVERVQ